MDKITQAMAELVGEGDAAVAVPATESLMFVLIALISKLVEKEVISADETEEMFIELEALVAETHGPESIQVTVLKRFEKILFTES